MESTYIGDNEAHIGGGMYLISESDTNGDNHAVGRFDRCVFQGNSATYGGGSALNGVGGITSAALNFRGCSFIGNVSKRNGGGVSVGGPGDGSSSFEGVRPTFSYCLFTCNHAGVDPPDPGDSNADPLYHAGAVLVTEAVDSITFANCLVHDNSTTQGSGGGIVMALQFQYDTTICNTSFQSNRATYHSADFETSCMNCEIGGNVPGRGCGGGLYVDNAWCDDPQADADARYVCLSFAKNEASYACTSQVRIPGCSEPTDECPRQCNTNSEGPCEGCNAIGVGLNIPSVEGLTCGINPLKRLFCPIDTCAADLDGNGTVDGADLTILLGNWADDAVSCEEDAYPLTNGNPGLERMDIESAPLHRTACSGPPTPCLPLWIDPAWLNQLECSNPSPDINCDGTVDGADLTIVLGNWGPCE
jgi:hypothetical protein